MPSRVPYSRHLSRKMSTLVHLTRLVNSTRKLDQQLHLLLDETRRILEAEQAVFYLVNEERQELLIHFVWEGQLKRVSRPFGAGIAEYVILNGKVVNVADAYKDPRFQRQVVRLGETSPRSFLAVPMANRQGRTCGCLQLINKREGAFDQKDTEYLMIMADLMTMAIQNALAFSRTREYQRLEREIQRAVGIQRQLLPTKVPQVPGYEIFAFNQPSRHVGGDYYDFFPFPRTLAFTLADVSGKGVPAALLTANLHAFLHAFANEIDSGKEVVRRVNRHFYLYTSSDMFATFFWGNLNYHTHQFRYVNAGHIPPLLVHRNGTVEKLKSSGLPIGIMDSFEYQEKEISLEYGDMMILFSDGITEASGIAAEQFGKRRLLRLVEQNYYLSAKELGRLLISQLRQFTGSGQLDDDMTLMIVKRKLDSL